MKKGSTSNHAQLKTFFTRDMTLLDQEFWAVFRTEGVLFKGYGNYMGESAELCRLMGEYFDIRDEILDALLRGLTSDFSAFNSAAFHSVYTDLQPTDAENRARFGQLMAVLTAEPSASVGFAQTMLQNVLKACAPANLQKTPDLQPLEQLDLEQLIDALGANLYRTEKKPSARRRKPPSRWRSPTMLLTVFLKPTRCYPWSCAVPRKLACPKTAYPSRKRRRRPAPP